MKKPCTKTALKSQQKNTWRQIFFRSYILNNFFIFYISFAINAQNLFQVVLSETANLQNILESYINFRFQEWILSEDQKCWHPPLQSKYIKMYSSNNNNKLLIGNNPRIKLNKQTNKHNKHIKGILIYSNKSKHQNDTEIASIWV